VKDDPRQRRSFVVGIPLQIRVFDNQQLVFCTEVTGPVDIGRQDDRKEAPHSARELDSGVWRVVIAQREEDTVSRHHALIEPLSESTARLKNISANQLIGLSGEPPLRQQETREVGFPVLMTLGRKVVRIQPDLDEVQSLPEVPPLPGGSSAAVPDFNTLAATAGGGVEVSSVIAWLRTAMEVIHSAASSHDFFSQASRAMVDLIALDTGGVWLWDGGDWKPSAVFTSPAEAHNANWKPSHRILNRVREEKRTLWQVPGSSSLNAASLASIRAVVVAPIFSPQGEVIGALYGDRRLDRPRTAPSRITKLEAMLVEFFAHGVAVGLARLEQERAALRARVLFEQFVTPEVARQLDSHPNLLEGREEEVTLLFCDVRGFSSISERLTPAVTVAWIGDVMDTLSECVAAHHGTLVSYIGDELLAMWGAPVAQPNHAALACRAALAMLEQLPHLNERWQTTLQERTRLGIGVNTGPAQVGNTGSKRKPQYGPLGTAVNLASRVQGATRYLRTRLVITEATRTLLDDSFAVRRLCKVRVVNIAEPVNLFELALPGQSRWDALKQRYEQALSAFEDGNFRVAAGILGSLVNEYPEDGPTEVLNARSANALHEKQLDFDPVWDLPGK
jgi:adenylate cyclase